MTQVSVRGGELFVQQWGSGEPLVAIHGITASHLAWAELAHALPHRTLIAPDLRGRGASNGLPGPYGMRQHAEDIIAMLDALGLESAPIVGHSMGAFAALVTAHLYPDRISSVLLVDGGLTLTLTEGQTSESRLGPAASRLAMTFADRAEYQAFWRSLPAFANFWSPEVAAYADYDLVGDEPHLRSRTAVDAMRVDSVELYGSELVEASVAGIRPGTVLLTAPRGLQDETPGLYSPAELAVWESRLPQLASHEIADTNHYTIVMSPAGARAIAAYVD